MHNLAFTILIHSSPERVWDVLWGEHSYPAWTSVFSEGSRVETTWEEGSKVLFLDGKGSGMVSRIARIVPNEYMSFEHLGEVKEGVEDTQSEKVKTWAGSKENCKLTKEGNKTLLEVDMDINEEWAAYFNETFPKAMDKVKELSE